MGRRARRGRSGRWTVPAVGPDQYRRLVPEALDDLLRALHVAVAQGADVSSLTDEIEARVEDDPDGSRPAAQAFAVNAMIRLWALGLLGDPRDFDTLNAGLVDPDLRFTALEALAHQPDAGRVDDVARSFVNDPDPRIRATAVGMVAFRARPGALAVLRPLAADADPQVRMVLAFRLGQLGDNEAEPTLRLLLDDPDEQVRKFAIRGMARLNRE